MRFIEREAARTRDGLPQPRVAIVVNTYNQAHYLEQALASCAAQTVGAAEILVVDDGSTDDPERVVARFPSVRFLRQANAGLAAARNSGLRAISSEHVVFLDADDRLTPVAIEAGLGCFRDNPDAWLVYGAHQVIDEAGKATSPIWLDRLGPQPLTQLLRGGNAIAMHATVMYRRDRLVETGGFDPDLRACEDYDLYLRIASIGRIAWHEEFVAEYRHHASNMSRDVAMMLRTAIHVLERRSGPTASAEIAQAVTAGRNLMKRRYGPTMFQQAAARAIRTGPTPKDFRQMTDAVRTAPLALALSILGKIVKTALRPLPEPVGRLFGDLWTPKPGAIQFGDFGRMKPVGGVFGYGRGTPIDRYYIDRFLTDNAPFIKGRTLEIGDDEYTRRFGGSAVAISDVLHVHADNPKATIVGDLSDPEALPKDAFDCIVLTQTLHLIYDMRQVIQNLYAALAPGGSLLVTVPGISPIEPWEWRDTWYWSLTEQSLKRLLEEAFAAEDIDQIAYGNVFAAVCFIEGVSVEDVPQKKLDPVDKSFPVLVAARAVKGASR